MLPLLFTVFIDSLGFGIVFPIFSPLIVNNEGGVLPAGSSTALLGLIFGLLVSAYCIGQFLGGPFLGALSDRYGRKKVLIYSMVVAGISFLLASGGIFFKSLTLLFLFRFFGGVSAGSYAVCQSAVADQSTPETKTKNLALVGTAFWVGFVIGPYIGGQLGQWGYVTPFFISAVICFINSVVLVFFFHESLQEPIPSKMGLLSSMVQMKNAFLIPKLRGIFTVMFIFCLGWGFFTEFSPVFLVKKHEFSVTQIGNFYAWIGIWIALSQGLFIRPMLKRFRSYQLFPLGLLILAIAIPLLLIFKKSLGLYFVSPAIAFSVALIFPTAATIVSNVGSDRSQGEILGAHNSVQWAAIALPPLFSGSLVALYPTLPLAVGGVSMLSAFLIFLYILRKKRENPLE